MASEKIDALELDITSKTSSENIDKLIESLSKLSTELNKLKSNKVSMSITNTGAASKSASTNVNALSRSFVNQTVRIAALIAVFRKLTKTISSSVANSMTYLKSLNMFTVSLGKYADSATQYGETVRDALGIDIAGWQDKQGIFQTLVKGMGVAGDKAAYMSQNLTQLAYDISSFYGITVTEAANKLKSAMAGRTQPVRTLGYSVDQAQAVDYAKNPANYGKQTYTINQQTGAIEANTVATDKNTQHKIVNFNQLLSSEKAIIRYNLLMTENTQVQGNYARALKDPYNQMVVFKEQLNMTSRAFGNMFIPALNQVLPYLSAFAQLAQEAFQSLANLFGFEIPDMKDRATIDPEPFDDVVKATGKAKNNAKKMKDYMLGIDELNVINPNTGSGTGGGAKKGENSNLNNMLLKGYDFLSKATENSVKEAKKKIKQFFDDLEKDPFLLGKLFVWGAGELGSGFWEWFLGKTPEEFAKEVELFGSDFYNTLYTSLMYSAGKPGSYVWEGMFGSPEEMAKRAGETGVTVGQQFAIDFGDTFIRGLEGLFILLPQKINEWLFSGISQLEAGKLVGALGDTLFGDKNELAKRAAQAGNEIGTQFAGEFAKKYLEIFNKNPALKSMYKLISGRDAEADLKELNKKLTKEPSKAVANHVVNNVSQFTAPNTIKDKYGVNESPISYADARAAYKRTQLAELDARTAQYAYVSPSEAKEMAESYKKAGLNNAKAYAQGEREGTYDAKTAAAELFNASYNGLNQDGTAKKQFGYVSADAAKAYYTNLTSKTAINKTEKAGDKLANAGINGAASKNGIGKGFYNTGSQAGSGYVLGIQSPQNLKKYAKASETMGGNVIDALRNFLHIKSPSRLTMTLGDYTAQGFALGISNNAYLASNAAKAMASSAVSAMSNANDISKKIILNGSLANPIAATNVSIPNNNAGYGIGMANSGAMASLATSLYQAVVSGIATADTNRDDKDIKVIIDGKEIFKVVQKEQRDRGVAISNGTFSR